MLAQVGGPPGKPNLVVSISARHVHLTDEHVETLFGPGHKLTRGEGPLSGRLSTRPRRR